MERENAERAQDRAVWSVRCQVSWKRKQAVLAFCGAQFLAAWRVEIDISTSMGVWRQLLSGS